MRTGVKMTRYATNAARRSASAAAMSTKFAEATIEQMRSEQRPWVCMLSSKIDLDKPIAKYRVTAKNFGSVPGIITGCGFLPFVTDRPTGAGADQETKDQIDSAFEEVAIKPQSFSILPGVKCPFRFLSKVERKNSQAIRDGKKMFLLVGIIQYRAACRSGEFTTRECFEFDPDTGAMYIHPEFSYLD